MTRPALSVTNVEAQVLAKAAGALFFPCYVEDPEGTQWDLVRARLLDRGLLDAGGRLAPPAAEVIVPVIESERSLSVKSASDPPDGSDTYEVVYRSGEVLVHHLHHDASLELVRVDAAAIEGLRERIKAFQTAGAAQPGPVATCTAGELLDLLLLAEERGNDAAIEREPALEGYLRGTAVRTRWSETALKRSAARSFIEDWAVAVSENAQGEMWLERTRYEPDNTGVVSVQEVPAEVAAATIDEVVDAFRDGSL